MKFLKIILIIIALLVLFAFKTLWQAGTFKSITNHFSGTIQTIDGPAGVEDITIDQNAGIAFLSSDDRWLYMLHQKPAKKGIIYTVNLHDSTLSPVDRSSSSIIMDDFHPHGISFFRTLKENEFSLQSIIARIRILLNGLNLEMTP